MSDIRIAVIIGSTRPNRVGEQVGRWVLEKASALCDASFELVDLADHPLPLLDEPIPAASGKYQHEHTKAWAATIEPYDGFVFVTPEYNHSIPAALKNAIDYLYAEWNNKAAALVSYGSSGGLRAAEHLRQILGELQIADVRQQLEFSLYTDFEDFTEFTPDSLHEDRIATLVEQLVSWSTALKSVRG